MCEGREAQRRIEQESDAKEIGMLMRNGTRLLLAFAVAVSAVMSVATAGCSDTSAVFAQKTAQTDKDKRAIDFARGTLINCCIEPSLSTR